MEFIPQLYLFFLCIPAILLCIIIASIILKKYLKFGSFFKIFIVSGILDILHGAMYLWWHWVRFCYPSELYILTAHFCTFFDLLLCIVHLVYNFLMGLNRFSATFVSYSTFWTSKLVTFYLAIVFLISTISSYPIFKEDKDIILENGTFIILEKPGLILQRMIVAGYALIFETLSVVLSILTIYRLKNFKTTQEKKLIIVTSSHTFIALLFILYEASMVLKFTDPLSIFLHNYLTAVGFTVLCFNFYTILVADSRIRKDFCCEFEKSTLKEFPPHKMFEIYIYFLYTPAFLSNILIASIIRQKYLKSGSFYQIFLVSGALDILHLALYFWLHWVKDVYTDQLYIDTAHFCTFWDMYLSILHIFCNFLMALNRFSATFMNFGKFWTSKLIKIYLTTIFIISTISSYPIFVEDKEITITDGVIKIIEKHGLIIQRIIVGGYAIVFEAISVILTIITIYRIRHFATSHEKKLIIVTTTHSIIAFIFILHEASTVLKFTDPVSQFLYHNLTNVAFTVLCFNFFTILVADSRIRLDFCAILGFWKKRGNGTISNVNSNTLN
ncbi:unnamed protein product [Caenorhabditis angaria]|uniref:Serpentine receptor class gamma n=1 Tax=Caenorhabditis angaria TaxID=860376 RepID=A0A9P1N1M9_9PELO|nr:unnamed protein product [Caenorhabditis angaria]